MDKSLKQSSNSISALTTGVCVLAVLVLIGIVAFAIRQTKKDTFIDGEKMLGAINQQLSYGPRYVGSPGHKEIQKFLIGEMQEQTGEAVTQSWDYKMTDGNTRKMTNIIGRLHPAQGQRIILGTHYDSKRFADLDHTHKNQPVPGANDSASGVAVLLELARILADSPAAPSMGVDIIFFDGEEGDVNQGSDYTNWKPLGSTYFAKHLNEIYGENRPASALILDMVCDKNLKIYKERSSIQNAPAQVESFWSIARDINDGVFQNEVKYHVADDHTPLNKAGVPSFLLIDFEYPPFHSTGDTLDKCSAESLETVARAIMEYVYSYH